MENSPSIDRSSVPDWNFIILMNEFDDDYWDDDFERANPEAFHALSNINRKCSSVEQYEEQMEIYNKYIPEAEAFYGGPLAIKFLREEFENVKGLPRPPKLKSKLMKKYIEGAYYQHGKYVPKINESVIKAAEDKIQSDIKLEEVKFVEPEVSKEFIRKTAKVINESRLSVAHKASEISFNTDIIAQIAANADMLSANPYMEINAALTNGLASLSIEEHEKLYDENAEEEALLKEREPIDGSDDDVPSYSSRDSYAKRNRSSIYIAKVLDKAGQMPFTRDQVNGMTESRKSMLSNYFGKEAFMTPKQLKKLKKQRKKEMQRYQEMYAQSQADTNRALANILTSNSIINRMKYD
jgi:hypothetical protein